MHPDLARVAELAEVDAERDRVLRELAAARAMVEQAELAEREAMATRDELLGRLAALRNDERATNRRIEEYRSRMDGATRILETGAGNATAAERQIEQCRALLDETETNMLEVLERQDALSIEIEEAEKALAIAGVATAEAARVAPDRIATAEARLAALDERRAALYEGLPRDMQTRYDGLRSSKKRFAVARIEGEYCSACRMTVIPQHVSDIRRGLIDPCRGCGRWLVIP